MDILGDAENSTSYKAQLKMNPRVTPRLSGNRVLKKCLLSQGFQEWICWAMPKIPHFMYRALLKTNPRVTPRFS